MAIQNKIIIFIVFIGFTALMWFSPRFAGLASGEDNHDTHTQMPEQQTLPETDRPIFVEFYSDECGICERLKPGIAQLELDFNGRIEFFRVDANAMENRALAENFNVYSLPSFFIVSPDSEIVFSHEGLISIESLRDTLQSAVEKYTVQESTNSDS